MSARQPFNKALRIALFGGATALVLVIAAIAFFVTSAGRSFVLSTALDAATGKDLTIKYRALAGDWPGTLIVNDVVISDAKGPWLSIDQLRLDWRPLSLLIGRLSVRELAIDAPHLMRLPETTTDETTAPIDLSPPIAMQVDRIRLSQGRIEMPQFAAFEGEAAILWYKNEAKLTLALQRTDGVSEHAKLRMVFDRNPRVLALDADIASGKDGLLPNLLGWPDTPIAFLAKGEGPATAWQLHAAGDVGGIGTLTFDGKLAWTDAFAFSFTGEAKPGRDIGPSVRAFVGPALTFNGDVARRGGEESLRFAAKSTALAFAVDMTHISPRLFDSGALAGNITLRTTQAVRLDESGLGLEPSIIQGQIGGTAALPEARLTLSAAKPTFDTISAEEFNGTLLLKSAIETQGPVFKLDGDGLIKNFANSGTAISPLVKWTLSGAHIARIKRFVLLQLSLSGEGFALAANGTLNGQAGASTFSTKFSSERLSVLSPLIDAELEGSGTVELQAKRNAPDTPWQADLEAAISQGIIDGTLLFPFGSPLALRSHLEFADDEKLAIRALTIKGEHLDLAATGDAAPGFSLRGSLKSDFAALGQLTGLDGTGVVEGQFDAVGSWGRPRFNIGLSSANATIEGRPLGKLEAKLKAHDAQMIPAGHLSLRTQGPLGQIALESDVTQPKNGEITFGPISGEAFGGAITGTIGLIHGDTEGHLEAAFGSMSALLALASGEQVASGGYGKVSITLGKERALSAALESLELRINDLETTRITARFNRQEDGKISAQAEARDGDLPGISGPLSFSRIALAANGPEEAVAFSVDADGLLSSNDNLRARGTLDLAGATHNFVLSSLDGKLWNVPISLKTKARIIDQPQGLQISPATLAIGTGQIDLAFQRARKSVTADVKLDAVPLSFVGSALGADWSRGKINGSVVLSTVPPRPNGKIDLRIVDAQFTRHPLPDTPPLNFIMTGQWNGRELGIDAHDEPPGASPANLALRLPLVSGKDGVPVFAPQGALSGHAAWTGKIGSLFTLLPLDEQRLDGDANISLDLAGIWDAPRLTGSATLKNGVYENLTTGTKLSNLTLDLNAGTEDVRFKLAATDGAEGRTQGEGRILLARADGFPVTADLRLTKLRIVDLDSVTARASGAVAMKGPLSKLVLSGKITMDSVDASIPNRLPPSIPQLPVSYAGMPSSDSAAQIEDTDTSTLALDLAIDIPAGAFLRGRGLNAQLAGGLSIGGTISLPTIAGELRLVRGTLTFGGHDFPLTDGLVRFDGTNKIDPSLHVVATRTVEATEISLAVTGTISRPQLDVTSRPSLPNDEALARLLFGKPAGALTPVELVEIARAVATITGSGPGGGFGVVDRARRALGLDVLSFDTGTTSGDASSFGDSASVSAGRHINNRVYVGVRQGTRSGTGALELNVDLRHHLSVTSEVGQTGSGTIGLDWKWDY